MKYTLSEKEARQLKKQGYDVIAGEMVEVFTMPEWLRNRAKKLDEWMCEPSRVEEYDRMIVATRWTGAELKSLARALGADRNTEVRELLNM